MQSIDVRLSRFLKVRLLRALRVPIQSVDVSSGRFSKVRFFKALRVPMQSIDVRGRPVQSQVLEA